MTPFPPVGGVDTVKGCCIQLQLRKDSMKQKLRVMLLWSICVACPLFPTHGDTATFVNGRTVAAMIVRTNGEDLLVMTDHFAFNCSKSSIKEIKIQSLEFAGSRDTNRIPAFQTLFPRLASQGWATDLRAIPATLIDSGVLSNVPYLSFRCGEDYELNVYGEPEQPCGVEIGVYHSLTNDPSAIANCVDFLAQIMSEAADARVVHRLNLSKDKKTRDGLTFEVTPPSDADAYNGWWVSVYSERGLEAARASAEEIKNISVPKAEIARQTLPSDDASAWNKQDLKFARPDVTRITFATRSGMMISNAVVEPYRPGVSLVWHTDTGNGGIVKLSDLPPEVRQRFGYDPDLAALADAAEAAARSAESVSAAPIQATATKSSYSSATTSTSDFSAGTGRVWVNGYTIRDGTQVSGYYRRR